MIEIVAPKSLEEMEKIWNDAIEKAIYYDKKTDDGIYMVSIYKDYRDEIPMSEIKNIVEAENPREYIDEMFNEWVIDYENYDYQYLEEMVSNNMQDDDMEITNAFYDTEFTDYLTDHVIYYYDQDEWLSQQENIILQIDVGNANYDFTCDNVLNYCGNGTFDEHSSILWLTRQQGKEKQMINASQIGWNSGDKFVTTVVQELENFCDNMGTLTFIFSASIKEFLEMRECKDHITLDKNTMCGLFDAWNGGGSLLEIELSKDVIIPKDNIYDIWIDGTRQHGYDVDEVYGLCGECWETDMVKEIA